MNNIFKPEANQTYTIALKYVVGRLVNGNWGMQLMWFLTDGRRMYTPRIVQGFIDDLGLKPHQPFTLSKAVVDGKTEWKVSPACKEVSKNVARQERALPQAAAVLLNGAGPLDSPIPEDETVDPPPVPLAEVLKGVVGVVHRVEQYADSINYPVRFTPSDILAMAISMLQRSAA
jgi:hypothetical protein